MTILNLRPVGWDGMTPRQWGTIRELIGRVWDSAWRFGDAALLLRAQSFLDTTEGYDV